MHRFVIWQHYQYEFYEVLKETGQRFYGKAVKLSGRWCFSQQWIDKRQVIAEVRHEERDKAIEAGRVLIEKLEDIRQRHRRAEAEVDAKFQEEKDETLKPYRIPNS